MRKRYIRYMIYVACAAAIAISFLFDSPVMALMSAIQDSLLDGLLGWVTRIGSVVVVLIVMGCLFMWTQRKREWVPTILSSFVVSVLVSFALKMLFHRARPNITFMFPYIAVPDYSFPSMHAAVAFAALPILDREFPKLRWFWVSFAVLVAVSRLYFGVHYFSDVVAGGILGYLIGVVCIRFEERTGFFRRVMKRWMR